MPGTDGSPQKDENQLSRTEFGELLRLFSSLGITLAVGITLFFVAGHYADKFLAGREIKTFGLIRTFFIIGGVALSVYWCYLRIAKHLEKFDPPRRKGPKADANESEKTG